MIFEPPDGFLIDASILHFHTFLGLVVWYDEIETISEIQDPKVK